MSKSFIRKHFLEELRKNNFRLVYAYPPHVLSKISKILYIYEMESESKDIDELAQSLILKIFNNLKNVDVHELAEVIKDYSITRGGSR